MKYLTIDATTHDGQKKIADMHNLSFPDCEGFWDKPLHETYLHLLIKVQTTVVLDGWGAVCEEGMHRFTGLIMMYLGCALDTNSGYLKPHTITKRCFTQQQIGKPTGIPEVDFQQKWLERVFHSNTR